MMETLKDVLNVALRIVGALSVPLLIISIVFMIKNLRRAYPVRPKGLALQTLTPVLVFVIYALLLSLDPPKIASGVLFVVGIGLGVVSSLTTRLGLDSGQVVGRRSIWYLVAWAVTFSVTQLLAVFARSEYAAWGFTTLYFSLGLTLGTNAMLFVRRQRILAGDESPADLTLTAPGPAPAPAYAVPGPVLAPPPARCPGCGRPVDPGARFCTGCGVRLA